MENVVMNDSLSKINDFMHFILKMIINVSIGCAILFMFIFSAISIAIKAIIEDLCSIHNKL
jgi:hypothetical protein